MKKLVLVCWMFLCLIPYTITNASSIRELEEGEVYINYTNFPDEHFREYLRDNFDTDGDGIIQIEDVKVVNLYHMEEIEDLKGIELFTDLEELDCSLTSIATLDLSSNNNLKELNCSGTFGFDYYEGELNLSGASKLEYLDISYCKVNSIDLSDCVNLKTLICKEARPYCDVSNNVNLEYLDCSYNGWSYLDLSNNIKLKELKMNALGTAGEEPIEYIDLSNNVNLEKCDIDARKADFTNCDKLQELTISFCNEVILDNENLEKLYFLHGDYCHDDLNKLESIDLSKCPSLKELEVHIWCDNENCRCDVLDLSQTKNLSSVVVYLNAQYKSLILPKNNKIYNLDITSEYLENINLSECGNLKNVRIIGGKKSVIDLGKNTYLESATVDFDEVEELIIPTTGTLSYLELYEDDTTGTVDFSKITGLDYSSITDEGWDALTKTLSYKPWELVDAYANYESYYVKNNQIENIVLSFHSYEKPYTVTYKTHVQTYGWQEEVEEGEVSGTTGESKRLEGIVINFEGSVYDDVIYTTHIQSYGWLPWCKSGEFSGTEGESKRMEAIMIDSYGEFDIYYRVHAQGYGWLGWAKNGEPAGTAGYSKRLEGIQIVAVKEGEEFDRNIGGIVSAYDEAYIAKEGASPVIGYPDTSATNPVVPSTANVSYRTHVQTYGWQGWKYNGQASGTSGESKRLEGIKIKLSNLHWSREGSVLYTTHVQNYGWLGDEYNPATWSKDGEFSGTEGESKRLEAIRIMLSGDVAKQYDIYYRVHAQNFGWLGWAKNGEPAGTAGYSKRLEAIEIVLVDKFTGVPPVSDVSPYIEK